MNTILRSRLQRYTAMTTAALGVALGTEAAIIHTDLDPDTVMSPFLSGDSYEIDFDGDGLREFRIDLSLGWTVDQRAYLRGNPYDDFGFMVSSTAPFFKPVAALSAGVLTGNTYYG